MKFIPIKDNILVHVTEEKTKSKIVVPEEQKKVKVEVVAVGPDVDRLSVDIGDVVLLNNQYNLYKLEDNFGKDMFITNFANVVGIIKED